MFDDQCQEGQGFPQAHVVGENTPWRVLVFPPEHPEMESALADICNCHYTDFRYAECRCAMGIDVEALRLIQMEVARG